MNEVYTFLLSTDEFHCLERLLSNYPLASQLRVEECLPGGKLNVRLNRAEAERLRDHRTRPVNPSCRRHYWATDWRHEQREAAGGHG